MISVSEALERVFSLVPKPQKESVGLASAGGRVLAVDAVARRNQPPFDVSTMDGYALQGNEVAPSAQFAVIGESAAGARFGGQVSAGEAVRIFTGAPIPAGADRVVIQEDVSRNGDQITLNERVDKGPYTRAAGADFQIGSTFAAGRRLSAADIALLAAMNIPAVTVFKRPVVALIASGNELVMPGETPGDDQIISSNTLGLAELVRLEYGQPRLLPIVRDNAASIRAGFEMAADADLIVTSGGASVGDHDLIGPVAKDMGMNQSFYKVAMRPGKPLMAGKMDGKVVLGLPGNPVSSMVCGHIFMRPTLRAMQGLPAVGLPRKRGKLAHDLGKNGPREHYMRAYAKDDGTVTPAASQDSALLSILSNANALMVRPPDAPAIKAGVTVEFIHI